MGALPAWLVFAAGSVLLTLLCYARVLSFGFTDMDALLHVRASRVEGAGDLVDLLSDKLTGGRARVGANFYRPGVMLLFAGLRAAFGWQAWGYHAVDLALHAGNGLLLGLLACALARRTGVRRPDLYGLLCLAIFVTHPLGVEVVPAIARNGDLLVTVFVLAALCVLDGCEVAPSRGVRTSGFAPRLLAFYALFAGAIASKEPGVVLLGAAWCYAVVVRREYTVWRRMVAASALAVPALVLLGLYLAFRQRVLGDPLGGYPDAGWSVPFTAVFLANQIGVDLLLPGFAFVLEDFVPAVYRLSPAEAWPYPAACGAVALAVAVAVVAKARARRRARAAFGAPVPPLGAAVLEAVRESVSRPRARLATFAGLVMAQYCALFAATGVYERRLLYAFLAFFSLAAGLVPLAAADALRALARTPRPPLATAARVVVLVALAVLLLLQIPQSPLFHRYDEWRETGEAARLLTEEMRDDWARLPERAYVFVANMPSGFTLDPMRRVLHGPATSTNALPPKAIRAWLEEQFPDKHIFVGALALYRYREPLAGFRHRARVGRGRLVYDVPAADLDSPDPARHELFRISPVGERRVALRWRAGRPPRDTFVLVFDGRAPRLVPVARLSRRR